MPQTRSDELIFLPLGGAGEIGMNLNLYGYGPPGDEIWVMVDLGVTFSDGAIPGVDVIMPDPGFIVERRDRLAGLVLTHAHEDHLGAVPYLWDRLRCPIYATPFAISILRRKLAETTFADQVEIIEVPLGGRVRLGPFDMELITLTHSIPEPNAIAIRTGLGTVLHTGDWKFDPAPVVGAVSDEAALRKLGNDGVLAMVCDSTNVFVPGESGSEADLEATLTKLIGECQHRVAVTCFATNVARLETIAKAARTNGRDVVLAGRSLRRIDDAARENGYLANVPAFLDEEDTGHIPADKVLIVCTGSQGEPRAALARIAAGEHGNVTLSDGDAVIFSSRIIPGNEAAIGRLHNALVARGIRVVSTEDDIVHVSGHPARGELVRMYQLVRPTIAVPVHGELRHMVEHATLASDCQVPHAVVVENGSIVRLAPGGPEIAANAPVGRLAADGNRLVRLDGELVRRRTRAMWHGAAMVTVVINDAGELAREPQISTTGLLEEGDDTVERAALDAARAAVEALPAKRRADDEEIKEAVRLAVRRAFNDSVAKKPVTTVHLVRV
ncbi:MAG: ribonuclease J [Rhodospirillales bacterium]|nr:ribonuclease J [Rhodospirillales bacterium]